MPIYAYKCDSCGLSRDVLQKISDAPLTQCPACGQPTLKKQVTAAGFQLKGSGWYVTDFRGGANAGAANAAGPSSAGGPEAAAKPAASAEGAAAPATGAATPASTGSTGSPGASGAASD